MSGLTRQEMKRDEVQEWMARAYDWLLDHLKLLILGAVGVVAAVALAVLMLFYLDHRGSLAQSALVAALKVYDAPIQVSGAEPDHATAPSFASEVARRERSKELFAALRSSYTRTPAGRLASVYLGRIAASEGNTAEARELWTAFLDRAKDDDAMVTAVQLSLYSLDRQDGRGQELIASLRDGIDGAETRVPRDALLNELALTLESEGDQKEADKVYQRLLDEFPTSPYAFQVRMRQQQAGGGSPFPLGT